MMKICYLKENALDRLKVNIESNEEYYNKNNPWLSDYFESNNFYLPSKINIDEIELKFPESSRKNFDLENTKRIYSGLKDLTITQATDERLWAYLTHVVFWNYMRKRWGAKNIKSRYFFHSNSDRALVRNGIARLWWFGYVSYDEEYKNPFKLTEILLNKQDTAHSLTERSFSRNPKIIKSILALLADLNKKERNKYLKRKKFRNLMKHINYLGGVTVLDALDTEEIEEIIIDKLIKLEDKAS